MLKFYVCIQVSDDFGYQSGCFKLPFGIKSISDNFAIVDISSLSLRNFFTPINTIVNGVELKDMTYKGLQDMMCRFGKHRPSMDCLKFDLDNFFDLDSIYLDKSSKFPRIGINYKNSIVDSFYLIDEGDNTKIIMSTFNKSHYYIDEIEWIEFLNYSNNLKYDDIKLNSLFKPDGCVNIIRQLKFYLDNNPRSSKSEYFMNTVLKYYNTNGFITQKQAKIVTNIIWL